MGLNKLKLKSVALLKNKIRSKVVLLRTDFNVPIKHFGSRVKIVDDYRIRASLPTIKFLIEQGAKVVIISHLGRPDGFDKRLSLKPISKSLSELLKKKVLFVNDCIGDKVRTKVSKLKDGDILLLENLRFYKDEESGDENFAKKLCEFADYFVFDAFSVAHRDHASTTKIEKFLDSYVGFLLEEEVKRLSEVLYSKKKPFIVLLGGVKIKTKLGLIKNFLKRADYIVIAGAMMFTFLKAQGYNVGDSIYKGEEIGIARKILRLGKEKIVLPVDVVVVKDGAGFKRVANSKTRLKTKIVSCNYIPSGYIGLDVGPKSLKLFKEKLAGAKLLLWNGPLGYCERREFCKATYDIANFITKLDAETIVCGGDTLSVLNKLGITRRFSFVSTGGGASLAFLSGEGLPALKSLGENYRKD